MSTVEGNLLCCYACGGSAAVTGPGGAFADTVDDRSEWPQIPCPVTEGCEGALEPEALN